VSDVAVPARLSVVPSLQLTVTPDTPVLLDTLKVTVTVCPVLAGLGETPLIVTAGASGAATLSEIVPAPLEPLLSEAVTEIVKLPPELYV
jgi:hypothetical protein